MEGNGGILEGHVVDFIYFSLKIKDWTVFPYIFNVADIGISVSIVSLLIFSKKLLPDPKNEEVNESTEDEIQSEEVAVEEVAKK